MRWSCPHCNVDVSMAEDKVGTGWFFSRCFRCNGHSLVRRAEVNLIKVDRTPPGERVLMTEPVVVEPPLLGEEATRRLAEYIRAGKNPNVVHLPEQPAPKKAPTPAASAKVSTAAPVLTPAQEIAPPVAPAPKKPGKSLIRRLLPILTGLTGVIAIASGVLLFSRMNSAPNRVPTTSDSTRTHAAAPIKAEAPAAREEAPASAPAKMWIKVRTEGANLFGGPGLSFPIVGSISADKRYEVLDWSDRWFKVQLAEGSGFGWVRNDLVQFVQ